VPLGNEQLRVIERLPLIADPLVGQRSKKSDDRFFVVI